MLPESVTTGFTPGIGPRSCGTWSPRSPVPSSRRCRRPRAGSASTSSSAPTSAAPERGVVYNTAVLLGPDGAVLGVYRKTHPFCTEMRSRGGWVTPGDEVSVVETDLGRIGLIICFDGDYPELSRITRCAAPR